MTSLAKIKSRDITVFKPEETNVNQAKADAIIKYAAKVKDWPLLEDAVEQKIDDQAEFVHWWDKTIRPKRGAGRGNKNNGDLHCFSMEDAEKLTKIKQPQVSKWRKWVPNREEYKAILFKPSWQTLPSGSSIKSRGPRHCQ